MEGLQHPLNPPAVLRPELLAPLFFKTLYPPLIAVTLFYHTNILLGDTEEEVPHCKLTAGINIKLPGTSQRINHISVHRKTNVKVT